MSDPDRPSPDAPPIAPLDDQPSGQPSAGLTYAELGAFLGLRPDGARAWAKRRKLPVQVDQDGRARVLIDPAALAARTAHRAGDRQAQRPPDHPGERPTAPETEAEHLRAELARAQAERDGALARLADRDREVERLHGLLVERGREAERMQVLLQGEQQQVRALTDQRPRARWWRRWRGQRRD